MDPQIIFGVALTQQKISANETSTAMHKFLKTHEPVFLTNRPGFFSMG